MSCPQPSKRLWRPFDAHALATAANQLSVHAAESAAAFEFDMLQTVVAAQDLASASQPSKLSTIRPPRSAA